MERKKKRLSFDHQDLHNDTITMTAEEHDRVQQLFSKKFVYSKSSHWTLKSTTVFNQFSKDSSAGEGYGEDAIGVDSSKHEIKRERKNHCDQHEVDSRNDASLGVNTENLPSPVELEDSELHHSPLVFDQPGSVPWQVILSPSHSRKYSSESCIGLQGNTNRIQQKAAQLQQQLERVKVVLPPAWKHEALMHVKENLNTLKDKLSDKEMIDWHQHTNSTNLAGKVVGAMKTGYNAELCTQAWCKFHEILAQNEVVPLSIFTHPPTKFNSIHLCEAPGAFITSLNHYLVSRGFDTYHHWRWLGTTLNPYYEGNDTGRMISDDRFIRTTFSNWFFGHDNSGDLMSVDNMVALMDCAATMGDIHLITADGSIDCQENPAEQEVIVSRLHHCEVLSSCILLAPGGTLVIKLFTMLEASSIALLYFLNCTFEKVTVCKPATSKSGNSEVYAVCSGYTAPLSQEAVFSVFSAVCDSADNHVVLLPQEDIPSDFLEEHVKCCLYFCQLQSATISENLDLYGTMELEHKRRLLQLQDLCVSHYISVCSMVEIDDRNRIRPFGYKSNFSRFSNCRSNQDRFIRSPRSSNYHALNGIGSSSISLPLGRLQGTFQQRQQQNQFPWQQLLAQIQDYCVDESSGLTIKCRQVLAQEEVIEWKVKLGRAFCYVASSHFCDSRILGDLQLVMTHAQVKFLQQKTLAQHSSCALTDAFRLLHTTCFFSKTHYHNSSSTITAVYHLALEDSITSFWPPDSPELSAVTSTFPHQRLSCVKDLQGRLEGEEGPVGLVVDVTWPSWLGEEEVRCQKRLLEVVLHACSYLPHGSTLILILPVALTRLTAGLLYIFAGLFHETSFAAKGKSMFLHQTLCFHYLTDTNYASLRLLETLRHAFSLRHTSPIRLPHHAESLEKGVCEEIAPANALFHGSISNKETSELDSDGSSISDLSGVVTGDDRKAADNQRNLVSSSISGRVSEKHDGTMVSSSDNGDQTKVRVAEGVEDSSRATYIGDRRKRASLDVCSKVDNNGHISVVSKNLSASCETTKNPILSDLDGDVRLLSDRDSVEMPCCANVRDIHSSTSLPCHCYVKGTSHTVSQHRSVPQTADPINNCAGTDLEPPTTQNLMKGGNDDAMIAGRTCNLQTENCSSCRHPVAMVAEGHPSATFQGESVKVRRRSGPRLVPVEVVPVLEIINDVTFTRFLQASNRLSISSFVSSVKAAELDRMASQQTPQQSTS